jgi:hypothetical protein
MSRSIRDVEGNQELLDYDHTRHVYTPRMPFYVCTTCFETHERMMGSLLESYTCRDHPGAKILYSEGNPNISVIPGPRDGTDTVVDPDSDSDW